MQLSDNKTGDKLPESPKGKRAKNKLNKVATDTERQALLVALGKAVLAQGIFTPFGIRLGKEGGSFVFMRQADDKADVEAFRAEIAETAGDTRIIVIDADTVEGEVAP